MFQSTGPITFPCGLDAIILAGVQCFENQADYKNSTGQAPPAYDPTLPIKLWRDTDATRTAVRGATTQNPFGINPFITIAYNVILRDSMIANGVTVYGDAVIEQVEIYPWLASRVNIPPDASEGAGTVEDVGNTQADQVFPIDPSITQAQVVQSPFGVSIEAPAAS